jgi:hypothetical protein
MTIPFGPQLVGQTEKTIGALLRRALADTGLSEPQWVALRLADQPDDNPLRARVADLARFDDADEIVTALEERGLVAGDALTSVGRMMLTSVLARSAELSGPIWDDIEDADAAARALTLVLDRARTALRDSA